MIVDSFLKTSLKKNTKKHLTELGFSWGTRDL